MTFEGHQRSVVASPASRCCRWLGLASFWLVLACGEQVIVGRESVPARVAPDATPAAPPDAVERGPADDPDDDEESDDDDDDEAEADDEEEEEGDDDDDDG